ncbi:Abi-alpha family protein [Mesorhizobium sp.]|uniref:Abi-alpha family protein n=1 Tax=Mesorhizobium sp. TaxID=1871066 RepID=UPI000FE98DAC|nr:Abi-alpha family protein [Mesorhizobium sp.]RWA97590.1 MAG: DUF4393 domain-containing protein [Mesorhizobium sp.]
MEKGGSTKIVLVESELEKEAAKVAGAVIGRTAGGVMDTVSDIFGGLIGDAIKEWRKRNLISLLARTAEILKARGVALEKAKALPMGEAYAMFEEASKQDDPAIAEMWAALLANAMDERTDASIDPAFVAVLRVISGVEAHVLKLVHNFKTARARIIKQVVSSSKWGRPMTMGMRADAQKLLQVDIENFRASRASIGSQKRLEIALANLVRERCLYVPAPSYSDRKLTEQAYAIDGRLEIVSEPRVLDALGDLSWAVDGQSGRADDSQPLEVQDKTPVDLSYDVTEFGLRLLMACEPG